MRTHTLAGCTAAQGLREMSLFYTTFLIACAPLWVTTTQARIHWRPLSLDINLTQMCPQRAGAHDWMNTRTSGAAVAAKPSAWAARRRFHYRPDFIAITAPLVADSGMKCHFPRYLHADYSARVRACEHAPCPHITSTPRSSKHIRTCTLWGREPGDVLLAWWIPEVVKMWQAANFTLCNQTHLKSSSWGRPLVCLHQGRKMSVYKCKYYS